MDTQKGGRKINRTPPPPAGAAAAAEDATTTGWRRRLRLTWHAAQGQQHMTQQSSVNPPSIPAICRTCSSSGGNNIDERLSCRSSISLLSAASDEPAFQRTPNVVNAARIKMNAKWAGGSHADRIARCGTHVSSRESAEGQSAEVAKYEVPKSCAPRRSCAREICAARDTA